MINNRIINELLCNWLWKSLLVAAKKRSGCPVSITISKVWTCWCYDPWVRWALLIHQPDQPYQYLVLGGCSLFFLTVRLRHTGAGTCTDIQPHLVSKAFSPLTHNLLTPLFLSGHLNWRVKKFTSELCLFIGLFEYYMVGLFFVKACNHRFMITFSLVWIVSRYHEWPWCYSVWVSHRPAPAISSEESEEELKVCSSPTRVAIVST